MSARSILIVDDVPEILDFFSRVARMDRTRTVEVTTTSDPAAAVELLAHKTFDVVISDFRMPHVNGLEVLIAARRANPKGRRVLMTGYNEIPATQGEIDAAAVQARLHKPLRATFLLEFLQACFSDDPQALAMVVQSEGG